VRRLAGCDTSAVHVCTVPPPTHAGGVRTSPTATVGQEQNRLLASLPHSDYARLLPDLGEVRLDVKRVLALADEPMRHVYFPRDVVISLLVSMEDGSAVEGASVGNEGMVGLSVFLGNDAPTDEMVVQIAGTAAQIPVESFRKALERSSAMRAVLLHYTQALMSHLARAAGCNRAHSVQERSARWLLMTNDRLGRDSFRLTHESLAGLLGVRRASISEAAETLQRAGLVEYRAGWMTIVDRHGLEMAACEDYRLVRDAYARMYRC